jgi:glucosyl-3-phosphoglycerate synthase
VKGCYTRPLELDGDVRPAGGGRVTELTARPLLNALWPELAGFVQPLGGEYAGRRSALERVPFLSGYGVEVGLLIDLLELGGLGSLAQVDLGVRRHTSQSDEALGAMAGQVVSALLARAGGTGPGRSGLDASGLLTQFRHDGVGFVPRSSAVAVDERPPMVEVAEYRSLRAGMAG